MTTKESQLWGGRFTDKPDETFAEFNDSFSFDKRLFFADVRGCIAQANGLRRGSIITENECSLIIDGLNSLAEKVSVNPDILDNANFEDVHSFIEGRLIESIGDAGRKLHTGRSRNDQVATAFRIWLRDEIDSITNLIKATQASLLSLAERHRDAVIPGYTHLQRAQPVMFAHWCLAYFEMLKRDRERLGDARKRVNVMPLGSGALAGTSFPIDRETVAEELSFESVSRNSLDAVSDRDFAVEFAAGCSILMVHLSRLAEDLILYCSTEFGFITLSDSVSSGSSLMPQKKNPDALELLRGKSGRVFGHMIGLLTMIKGLPLAYNKDMQEDKQAIFDCVDTVEISLRAAMIVLDNTSLNEKRAREAATKGYLNATELADHLVKNGVPFRTAHETVGRTVLGAIELGKELHELSIDELRGFAPEIGDDVLDSLTLDATLSSKAASGGTSPERVSEAIRAARQYLSD